jgi:hypothetical protein
LAKSVVRNRNVDAVEKIDEHANAKQNRDTPSTVRGVRRRREGNIRHGL